jgi:DNA replication protein DnaC
LENLSQVIQSAKTFQEAYEIWSKEQEAISDAAEPDFCVCGKQMYEHEEFMEKETVYCDGLWQYIITEKELVIRKTKVTKTVFCCIGRCPEMVRLEMKAKADKIAEKYKTVSGEPMNFESFKVNIYNQSAYDAALTFRAEERLWIWGSTGVGKTHLARSIYVGMYSAGLKVEWVSATELANLFLAMQPWREDVNEKLRAQTRIEKCKESETLFIDDLGSERLPKRQGAHDSPNEMFREGLRELLDHHTGGLVVTTNRVGTIAKAKGQSDSIESLYGDRLFSRLMTNMNVHHIAGEDVRKKTTKYHKEKK